jgi:uncharacterized membrane protein YtjA (UPF0391 family)
MHWRDLIALIAILAALVGFTFAGPGNIRNISQGVFYLASVVFLMSLIQQWRHGKPKEL